jgi:hypothetical protein
MGSCKMSIGFARWPLKIKPPAALTAGGVARTSGVQADVASTQLLWKLYCMSSAAMGLAVERRLQEIENWGCVYGGLHPRATPPAHPPATPLPGAPAHAARAPLPVACPLPAARCLPAACPLPARCLPAACPCHTPITPGIDCPLHAPSASPSHPALDTLSDCARRHSSVHTNPRPGYLCAYLCVSAPII